MTQNPRSGIRQNSGRTRRGAALIAVVVLLATVTVIMGVLTSQLMAQRRFLKLRHHQMQATWLARAGIEHAAAQILGGKNDYKGESVELLPDSKVRITVTPEPGKENIVHITCEAKFPLDGTSQVVRSATRQFRLVQDGDKSRLEPK